MSESSQRQPNSLLEHLSRTVALFDSQAFGV
jgi:hypothetical protein